MAAISREPPSAETDGSEQPGKNVIRPNAANGLTARARSQGKPLSEQGQIGNEARPVPCRKTQFRVDRIR